MSGRVDAARLRRGPLAGHVAIPAAMHVLLRGVGVLLAYSAASILLLGRHALSDPQHVCACIGVGDPQIFIWSLRWWPYALSHGVNPLFPHVVWIPVGGNLAVTTSIAFPSLLSWPLTASIGAVPAYDVLTLLSPAAAATAMYFLCEHVTGRRWPSLVGGWLFGFSTYELSQLVGHAHLMLIALLPIGVLVVLLRLDRRLGGGWFVAVMATLFAAQLLTSTEVLAESCAFGALAFAVGLSAVPSVARPALFRVALETIGSGLLAAAITSPFLYQALGPSRLPALHGAANSGTDAASFVVPLQVTLIRYAGAIAAKLPPVPEQGSYFGVPLLLGFGFALWKGRRSPVMAVVATVAGAALLLSFGSTLTIVGHRTIPLPWRIVAALPVAKVAIPDRLVLFTWFALAIATAIWLAMPGRWSSVRWATVLLGLVLILPDGGSPLFAGRLDNPPLFTSQAYKRVLRPGSIALVLPFGAAGYGMLWQAETDFAFRMPEGYLAYAAPARFASDPAAADLVTSQTAGSTAVPISSLRAFLYRYRVSTVLLNPRLPGGWAAELSTLGLRGRLVDGVWVYDVQGAGARPRRARG